MSYYNDKNVTMFSDALKGFMNRIEAGEVLHVTISNGNSKMGRIPSVSTLPFITCPPCCKCTCGEKCYAAKLAILRPCVLASYAKNTAIAIKQPERYFMEIESVMSISKYFRFHVSGDIMNRAYFSRMIQACIHNPNCQVLVFTKQYEIVNKWIEDQGKLPDNMHLLFSGWEGLKPENPYNLPETNVFGKEGPTETWLVCGGNCENCACRGLGCWQAKNGDTIAFKLH